MEKKCLKCAHVRTEADPGPDYACPKCGAVYAKLEQALLAKAAALKEAAAVVAEGEAPAPRAAQARPASSPTTRAGTHPTRHAAEPLSLAQTPEWMGKVAFFVVGLIFVVSATTCMFKGSKTVPESRPAFEVGQAEAKARAPKTAFEVTYVAQCDRPCDVSVTYRNGQDGTEQKKISYSHMPWRATFTAPLGAFLYLSAQNQSGPQNPVSLTTKILVDGVEVRSSTSEGAYVIASVSGRL